MFQLNNNEWNVLMSQIVTSKTETRGGIKKLPFAFTEHGLTMLAGVLKSEKGNKYEYSDSKSVYSHALLCKQ